MRLKEKVARAATGLAARAPRAAAAPLAWIVGALLWAGHGRATASENLERVYPDWSRRRRAWMAFASHVGMARSLVEFLHTPRYSDAEIAERVTLENEQALARAAETGEGVILLSGHFGNWEWLARRVRVGGYRLAVLFKPPRDPVLADRLRATRAAAGIEQIDSDDMRGAVRWLRRGNVLGIVMDQEPRKAMEGAVAPLFGRPTLTHVGPFRLARMAGSPLLTFFCRRTGPGRYRARLEPFPLSRAEDADRAVAADAELFNARLEQAVRRDPDHWLWMYRRWGRIERRRRASGEPRETTARG